MVLCQRNMKPNVYVDGFLRYETLHTISSLLAVFPLLLQVYLPDREEDHATSLRCQNQAFRHPHGEETLWLSTQHLHVRQLFWQPLVDQFLYLFE